ncbi:MAG: hypothetical protein Q9168_002139 [Polycauliona sp. 1 TL-2023]
MLSVPFIITLLAASGICVPLYSAPEASVRTLSSIEKRQTTWTSWSDCTDADDESTCQDTNTWGEGQDGSDGQQSSGRQQSGGGGPSRGKSVAQQSGGTTSGSPSSVSTGNVEPSSTEEEDPTSKTTPNDSTTTGNGSATPTNGDSASTDDNAMLAVINKWRTAYNVGTLSWSAAMAVSAASTGQKNMGYFDGAAFVHHGDGYGEVMTPGSDTAGGKDLQGFSPFEIAYVNWLCEVDAAPVASACDVVLKISPMSVITAL